MRKNKKFLALMLTIAFVFSIAVPAFASSENRVQTVPSIDKSGQKEKLGTLQIKEDSDFKTDFITGRSFTVTLPTGAKLHSSVKKVDSVTNAVYSMVKINDTSYFDGDGTVSVSGDYTIDIKLPSMRGATESVDTIEITPVVRMDGFGGGDIEATIDAMDSGITGGKFVIGRVASGDATTTTVVESKTIGDTASAGGDIRITENYANALKNGSTHKIKLKLPPNFKWNAIEDIKTSFLGGLSGSSVDVDDEKTYVDGRDAYVTVKILRSAANEEQRGIIQITPGGITAESNAKFGEVEISISDTVSGNGEKIDSADVVVAKYAEYGIAVKAAGDVEEVIAGKVDEELTKLHIKENIKESIVDNRKIRIDFPAWVKPTKVEVSEATGVSQANLENTIKTAIDKMEDSYIEFSLKRTGTNPELTTAKADFKLEFTVSIKGNASGDITAKVSGNAGIEGEAVIGKAVAPVSVTISDVKDVRVGIKEQPVGDIIITENIGEAIAKEGDNSIKLELSNGEWHDVPKVEVIEGNLEIEDDNISLTDGDTVLIIPVKSESTKPSKIKVSGAAVDLSRSVPEGNIDIKVKGDALILNHKTSKGYDDKATGDGLTYGRFDQDWVAKVAVAKVVTPADANQKKTATFKLGDNKMVINGVELSMDVAPYAANDRTYLPIRYVAKAVGVTDDNIMWNQADQSAVLVKGDRIIKLTLGSQQMLVNGVPMTMDVAPEVKSERIMLPIRAVAQALGCTVEWDAATQTVTVN